MKIFGREFKLFNYSLDGKGVKKEPEGPKNLKNFFISYARKFGQLVTVNIYYVFGNFPVLFAMLAIIFAVVKIISYFCYSAANKSSETQNDTAAPAVQAAPAAPVAPAPQADDEEEIVAAITAAISAYTGNAVGSFRVVSFKRIK